jgi:hypothetical protein
MIWLFPIDRISFTTESISPCVPLDKGQTLVSAKLNFGKQHASQGDYCCGKTYDFEWKGSRVGDHLGIKVTGGGGSWEDNSGYQLKKGTTKVSITLDEIGE